MANIREYFRKRAADSNPAILFEEQRISWREHVQASLARAAWLRALHQSAQGAQAGAPFHIGVLLENVPEFSFLLGAAAYAGAAVVGINPTRRGEDLARDIRHTDCFALITERKLQPLLAGLNLGAAAQHVYCADAPEYAAQLQPHQGAADPQAALDPRAPYLLIFTSGTTGHPKAALCSQARLALAAEHLAQRWQLGPGEVAYCAMPMFHSNQLMAGWAPALASGAAIAMRRRFSARGFLPDVRRYGITYMNYVGKPLTYILATPPQADDAQNTLRAAFGNEGAEHDLQRFAKRFGCTVVDSYGSTEGAISIARTPETPPGALGAGMPGTVVLNPESGAECPPAEFDAQGRLTNAAQCVGEIANRQSAPAFEGYYKNESAAAERLRDGIYWSGDLGYRDAKGFFYFAGRGFDWLRVDGENIAAAPIERVLSRYPAFAQVAVYGVPDEGTGDQVMAAAVLRAGETFAPAAFQTFLAAQPDLGEKWPPRYVRITKELPNTQTNKVLKRALRREHWECADPCWRREYAAYAPFGAREKAALRERFRARGREQLLDQ